MSRFSELRMELVRQLRLDAGIAESDGRELRRHFWIVPEHLRALEPEVALIVGDRGSGKTKLVSAALNDELRSALARRVPALRMPTGRTSWLRAYPNAGEMPDPRGFRMFASRHAEDREALQQLFNAYLVRTLKQQLDDAASKQLTDLLAAPAGDPEAVFARHNALGASPVMALDSLDSALKQRDEWIFVAYDELDTLVTEDRVALSALVRGLLGFWVAYARRWQRIRPKIFLRTDFYAHRGDVAGADLSKLSANRVELQWSDKNLYGALIKQLANTSEDWRSYCEKSKIKFGEDPVLGAIPEIARAEDAKPLLDRLVGEYMGANAGKGFTYRWILDHVRDGNRRASPRSLVQLVVAAAELEAQSPKATGVQLIHHTSLRNALDTVSKRHVEGVQDEFRWLPGLATRLSNDREVPWRRRELERLLKSDWEGVWSKIDRDVGPPADSPSELVDLLMELGIVRDRKAGKLDVPDLFLAGLGLARKGGVARGERARKHR